MSLPGTTKVFKVKGLMSGKAWIYEHGDRDHVATHVVSLPVLALKVLVTSVNNLR